MQLKKDPSILIKRFEEETSFVSMYVNDFLLASNTMVLLEKLKECLAKKYNIKNLGKVKIIIGWQISQDTALGTIKIDQSIFFRGFIIKEGLKEWNANGIPIKAGFTINMEESEDYKKTYFSEYQWLIGKLMYLAFGTKPNIAFVVRQLSKHNTDPKKIHLWAAKRVVQYLCWIMELNIIYNWETKNCLPRDPSLYGLTRFPDSNLAGDPKDCKLVIGYYFFLNGAVVLWYSKKQKTVSISKTETKYIALGHTTRITV